MNYIKKDQDKIITVKCPECGHDHEININIEAVVEDIDLELELTYE